MTFDATFDQIDWRIKIRADDAYALVGNRRCPSLVQHLSVLKKQQWPGNIRELKNVMERAVISSAGDRLRLDLAFPIVAAEEQLPMEPSAAGLSEFVTIAEFKELEKANITAALLHANWKIWGPGGAAELLGMKPSTLAYQMQVLGIVKQIQPLLPGA